MKRTSACIALLLLGATVVAQTIPVDQQLAEEEPAVRHYSVELIVFVYTEDVSIGTEMFLPDEIIPDDLTVDELLNETSDAPMVDEQVVIPDTDAQDAKSAIEAGEQWEPPFILLAEEDHTLGNIIHKFELLDAYETLFYAAWTQPTYAAEEALDFELQELGEVPEGLNGTITLYLSRYLHLVVDLVLDAESDAAGNSPNPNEVTFSFDDGREAASGFGYDPDVDNNAGIVRYRLQENRILKNGETRYFDHPKFGVLAKVTRVEEEPLEDNEEESPRESRQLLSELIE